MNATVPSYFLDTAVLALALGGEHPERQACRLLLEAAADGASELHISVETLQELLFHRMRQGERSDAVSAVRHVRAACVLHDFNEAVVETTLNLVSESSIRGRDAVLAATALGAGFGQIVSPDRDFDGVPGLRRIDPRELQIG